jgi:hypothetical protein
VAFDVAADRALWIGVLVQCLDDAATLPVESPLYDQAIAFLSSDSAYWREARAEVGAHLDLDGDVILRVGRRYLASNPREAAAYLTRNYHRNKPIDPSLERYDGAPMPDYLREILGLRHIVFRNQRKQTVGIV